MKFTIIRKELKRGNLGGWKRVELSYFLWVCFWVSVFFSNWKTKKAPSTSHAKRGATPRPCGSVGLYGRHSTTASQCTKSLTGLWIVMGFWKEGRKSWVGNWDDGGKVSLIFFCGLLLLLLACHVHVSIYPQSEFHRGGMVFFSHIFELFFTCMRSLLSLPYYKSSHHLIDISVSVK